jgi:hypothetical protein
MVVVMCRDMNAYSFGMTDSSLLLRWTVYSLEVYACVLGMLFLLWDVTACLAAPLTGSRAGHVTVVGRVTTCVLPVSSCHSHVKGLSLSCCAALVATAGVRCTTWVGARKTAFPDHSEQFPHFVHYICLIHCQEPILPLWSQQQFLHTAC